MNNQDMFTDKCLPVQELKIKREVCPAKHKLNPDCTYEISEDNLIFGNLLGQGSFCDVYEVAIKRINEDQSQDTTPIFPYAVKCLGSRNRKYADRLQVGVKDLAREANLLKKIRHKNIISFYGATNECLSDLIIPTASGSYSLVIERLHSTLEKQIPIWREGEKLTTDEDDDRLKPFNRQTTFPRRKSVALQIARALAHLHKNGIIYRDLKPENIGFDSKGTVKMFDFGLAKSIVFWKNGEEERSHTPMTGTLRYMAPEVAFGQNYGPKADVYSFGILLWQLFFLQTPFNQYQDSATFFRNVFIKEERPIIYKNINTTIKMLPVCCWAHEERRRPNFWRIVQEIEKEVKYVPLLNKFRQHISKDNKPSKRLPLKRTQ